MKKLLLLLIISFSFIQKGIAQKQKVKVLLLGSFHFDNPGLDVAKFENANIMTDKRQKEVREVLEKLKLFNPDEVFIEVPATLQGRLDSNIMKYKAGEFALTPNETHQLGYRLAKELNLATLQAVDYTEADFPFDSLVKSATEAKQYELLGYMNKMIDSMQTAFNESLKKHTIREILLESNTKASNDTQVGTYFEFLIAGKDGNHVGSFLSSEWWRRNMVIYENILKRLTGKEKRILVIFGSGHTALLQLMMKYNKDFEIIPLSSVL